MIFKTTKKTITFTHCEQQLRPVYTRRAFKGTGAILVTTSMQHS